MTISLSWPSPGVISSPFGIRTPGKVGSVNHLGIDFSWNNGWTISAAAAGRVIFTGSSGGYGNLTRIDHGSGWETRYAHQARFLVPAVRDVARLQEIGIIGDTGIGTGPHLHFELLHHGVRIDPRPYLPGGAFAGGDAIPLQPERKNDMYAIRHPNGTITIVGEFTYEHLGANRWRYYGEMLGGYTQCSAEEYAQALIDTQTRRAMLYAGMPAGVGMPNLDLAALASHVKTNLAGDFDRLSAQIDEVNTEIGFPTPEEIAAATVGRIGSALAD